MNVGFDSDLEGIHDAESARAWLRGLSDDPGARLDSIRTLLARVSESATAAVRWRSQTLNDVLEALRVDQWRAIVERLEPLAGRPAPFTPIEWPLLTSAIDSLQALRNLYKRAYAQTLRAGESIGGIPGARDSLAGVMPLVRALDAQARVVSLQLRHRCVPQAADWDELCVLARGVRRTSFQDESLHDAVPIVKPVTARALFVYPMLLECASLAARVGTEAELAQRLAARLAARVGYRIDHGAPRDNEHGPRIALTADYAVRLDTHRVPASLARWRTQWFGDAGTTRSIAFPLPLPENEALRLLADLERCWAPADRPRSTGAHPAASAGSRRIRLRFGLPKTHSADLRSGPGAAARAVDSPAVAPLTVPGSPRRAGVEWQHQRIGGEAPFPRTGGESQYEYGRWEQNTIIRLAFGNPVIRDGAAPTWIGESERAARLVDRPDGRTVIARDLAIPRAAPGMLVAVEEEADRPPDRKAGASRAPARGPSFALGTVEAIEQLPGREGHASRAHWLIVRLWAGQAIPVTVRVGDAAFFEDAWMLRGTGASSELPCLVMTAGRARGGDPGVLREPSGEVAIRFVSVLDRGTGYERLSMRTESARMQ